MEKQIATKNFSAKDIQAISTQVLKILRKDKSFQKSKILTDSKRAGLDSSAPVTREDIWRLEKVIIENKYDTDLKIEKVRVDLIKWMIGITLAIVGIMAALSGGLGTLGSLFGN